MLTREAMVEAFGEEGLLRLDVGWAREKGLTDADARILSELGLPVRADVAFTTYVDEGLETGAHVVFQTGDGEVDVLILGTVAPDGFMRYFLDLRGGSVGLLDLGAESPSAERVNSSLENFVEFLRRLRVRQQELVDAAGDVDNEEYTEKLWLALKELDAAAFTHGEAWWAMVLDNMMKRSYIAETRAFLDQRRAEVAELPSSAESYAEDSRAEESSPAESSMEEFRAEESSTEEFRGEESSMEDSAAEDSAGVGADPHDQSGRGAFDRALSDLRQDGYEFLDPERFAADHESYGLLCLPADLDAYFDADGSLVKDVEIAWKGALTSKVQSLFARQGLVVRVLSEVVDDEALYDMSDEERQKYADSLMDGILAAAHGEDKPGEGTVTCLAAGSGAETSDLCRIVAAFDRLAGQGYVAEPDLWPTASGAWQQVQERVTPGETRGAVFWTTQSHTGSFDERGDLVDDLYLQWAGDPDVIAEGLRTSGLEVEVPEDEGTAFVIRRSS